jgi:hypothetical protein
MRHTAGFSADTRATTMFRSGGVPMAVFRVQCAGTEVRIHETDHNPPHCHVKVDGRDVRVRLDTLEVFWSDLTLTSGIRKCLKKHQRAMCRAWKQVTIDPR